MKDDPYPARGMSHGGQPSAVASEHGPSCRRILIVGASEVGQALAGELQTHFPGEYLIAGFVADDPRLSRADNPMILGSRTEIADLVRRHRIDEVMIADFLTGRLGGVSVGLAKNAETPATAAASPTREQRRRPERSPAAPSPASTAVKRAFDVSLSLAALIAGAPLAGLAAIAIKLTSRGPVLYRQERVGHGGRLFTMYKLRTMVDGAENGTGPMLACKDDPRSTPVGRILRATKLDEWPQFFNVLRGDMSVVGPRPERLWFVQVYHRHIADYAQRHAVRPGITGLAQVRGGYRTHVYVKLRYDLMYVHSRSFWLDLWILAQTPLAILRGVRHAS